MYTTYTYNVINRPAGRSYLRNTTHFSFKQANHVGKIDLPQRSGRKAQRASDIHGIPQHVKWESFHPMIHQDPKVVPEERPRDPERVGRGDDKRLTEGKHDDGERGRIRLWKQRHARLVGQRALVPMRRVSVRTRGQGTRTHRWSRKMPNENINAARK